MDRSTLVILITLAVIAVFTVPTVRSSARRKKIYGGLLSQTFHTFGIMAYLGIMPTVLCGTMWVGWRTSLPIGLALLVVSFLFLILFAVVERRALPTAAEDRGWTEQDARSSGL